MLDSLINDLKYIEEHDDFISHKIGDDIYFVWPSTNESFNHFCKLKANLSFLISDNPYGKYSTKVLFKKGHPIKRTGVENNQLYAEIYTSKGIITFIIGGNICNH